MDRHRWIERPWPLALATLVLALVPVWLAFVNYRASSAQREQELFETTAKLVQTSLRLSTVRHVALLNVARNQLSAMPDPGVPEARAALGPGDLQSRLPHWVAIACVTFSSNRALVRWHENAGGTAPVQNGDDLAAHPAFEATVAQLRQRPFPLAAFAWDTNRLAVLAAILEPDRRTVRGCVIGWLDLDATCRNPQLPLVSEGAITLKPALGSDAPHADVTRLPVEESSLLWHVDISRGPRFNIVFARPLPWLVLGGGALCALLLAVLACFAARAREHASQAAVLRSALGAEREVGRLRSHFVSTVSHEFRTPLSVILSSADLLEGYAGKLSPERQREALVQIQDSTRHMNQMVEEVLLLGRIESNRVQLKPAPLELAEFCRDIAREVTTATRQRNPIQVEVAASPECPSLDASLLRSVLVNLLSNAAKYSAAAQPVKFTVAASNGEVSFTIRDEGIGILAEDLSRLGEPFQRGSNVRDISGTGLGLTIVKRCTALLGGRFQLESTDGGGTTARVMIPAASRETPPSMRPA